MSRPPVREIRAVYDDDTVRVYQAYSDEIADLAVAANSFEAPRKAGCWSAVRMTWIKPSAVWMAYRCGWTTMKDSRQARVLALDLSRARFEELLMSATLSHSDTAVGDCKKSPVVVQWDPEREMDATADKKQVVTRGTPDVRSIQIGLRGESVQTLLDASFVRRITDVTGNFRQAAALLGAGDVDGAAKALWPTAERPMQVPAALRAVLAMDATPDVPLASVAVPAAAPAPVEAGGPPAPAADADRLPLGAPEPKRLRSWGERSLAAALPGGSEGACKASSASADMPATPPPPPSASAGGATEAAAAVVSRGGGKAKGGGKAVNPRTESRSVAKLRGLQEEFGVSHIVTLLGESEGPCAAVRAGCGRLGLGWSHVPLSGANLAAAGDRASIERLPEVVALLAKGESVLVHCAAGMHRTGISCYVTLRLAGWSEAEAVEGVRGMREVTHEELVRERRGKPTCRETAEAFAAAMLGAP